MKLGINEISEGIYISAINKVSRQLKREGFDTRTDYVIDNQRDRIQIDLFAQRENEKRIYEFKLGKNKIQRQQFVFLQDYARSIGARLYIIYLEMPYSKKVTFEGVEDILYNCFSNQEPEELMDLAPKVFIKNIENVDIEEIYFDKNNIIRLSGQGTIAVEIEDVNNSMTSNNGFCEVLRFDFSFRLKLDCLHKVVIQFYSRIDTRWYYE